MAFLVERYCYLLTGILSQTRSDPYWVYLHGQSAAYGSFQLLALLYSKGFHATIGQSLAVLMAMGLSIELCQLAIPGRDAEVLDLLADMAGVVLAEAPLKMHFASLH